MKPRRRTPIHVRLERYIEPCPMTGCWLWAGRCGVKYGLISTGSISDGTFKVVPVHRLMYQLRVGEIPAGVQVLHKCDNPACVNPDHLFLGDDLANRRDMASKNRGNKSKTGLPYGVRPCLSKFMARSSDRGRTIYLGVYATVEEAASVAMAEKNRILAEAR